MIAEALGACLDRISGFDFSRSVFDRLAERRRWRVAFHHEAGHAVAWAGLFGRFLAITAQDQFDKREVPARIRKASCGGKPSIAEFDSEPLNTAIVIAAGAKAEMMMFGVASDGFIGDREHLIRLLSPPLIMPGVPTMALRPNLQAAQNIVYEEIDEGYRHTQAFLRSHLSALRAIGRAALARFEELGLLGHRFEKREILSAADVEKLFKSHPAVN